MKIAFCLFKYFPYGGLQRDFLRIAKLCQRRGHQVQVYTMAWQGDIPAGFDITIIEANKLANHDKALVFANKVNRLLKEAERTVDLVIGFNKMPGLDIYYCADTCYIAKVDEQKSSFIKTFYQLTRRYKCYRNLEEQVFLNKKTKILFLSDKEQEIYCERYKLKENYYLLPPNINKQRFQPVKNFDQKFRIKKQLAQELGLSVNSDWLLMVGSGFKTKGVDRSINLLKRLRAKNLNINLIVIGQDKPSVFMNQAKMLGVNTYIRFLSGREDIADFMTAATLLIHPAYRENTGTVILEAIIMGLPVVASGICGFSKYISQSGCGTVIKEPFEQQKFEQKVFDIITNNKNLLQSQQGLIFREQADIYNADQQIIDLIEHS